MKKPRAVITISLVDDDENVEIKTEFFDGGGLNGPVRSTFMEMMSPMMNKDEGEYEFSALDPDGNEVNNSGKL